MSARIYCGSPIDQFFVCFSGIDPNEPSRPSRRGIDFSIFLAPFHDLFSWLVIKVHQSLIYDRPSAHMGWEIVKAPISSEIAVHQEQPNGERKSEEEVQIHSVLLEIAGGSRV
jgi:hypothetical protein